MADLNHDTSTAYAIFAKTVAGRQQMAEQMVLPLTFPQDKSRWWFDSEAGVGLYHCIEGGEHRLVSIGHKQANDKKKQLRQLIKKDTDLLADLNGEFALILWNGERQQLLLARDQLGQMPLFLREDQDFYYISSNLEVLLTDPQFDCQLDLQSAFHYLAFGIPRHGFTLAKGVSKLSAGHCLRLKFNQVPVPERYFSPLTIDAPKVALPKVKADIQVSLDNAICAQAKAQQPTALLLSSGIDSSYIAMTLKQNKLAKDLTAYTVEFAKPCQTNESAQAAEFAKSIGIEHKQIDFDHQQVLEALQQITTVAEPYSAYAAVTHQHLLGQIAKDGHSTIIGGLGSDEIFGGYFKYLTFYSSMTLRDNKCAQLDPFEQLLWESKVTDKDVFAGIPRFFSQRWIKEKLQAPFNRWDFSAPIAQFYHQCRQYKPNAHLFEMMIAHECQHRIPDLLLSGFESVARGHGLNTVYPFLHHDLVQKVTGLGASERFERRVFEVNGEKKEKWDNKLVMRDIATNRLPAEICQRTRQAYVPPLLIWLSRTQIHDYIWQVIDNSNLNDIGLFDHKCIELTKRQVYHVLGRGDIREEHEALSHMWVMFTLAAWYDRYVTKSNQG